MLIAVGFMAMDDGEPGGSDDEDEVNNKMGDEGVIANDESDGSPGVGSTVMGRDGNEAKELLWGKSLFSHFLSS